jgi:hypothetical protein
MSQARTRLRFKIYFSAKVQVFMLLTANLYILSILNLVSTAVHACVHVRAGAQLYRRSTVALIDFTSRDMFFF